jgi:hypothetical protein
MSNVALCLKGIAYNTNYINCLGKNIIDYKNYDYVFKTNILNPLKQKYGKVDIYLSTYSSEKNKEILDYYNPMNYIFIEDNNQIVNKNLSAHINHFTNLNNLIENSNINYDIIIYTRFDISLYHKITYLDIKNTLNSIFYHGDLNNITGCDDNLFIITNEDFTFFKNTILSGLNNTHKINLEFEKKSNKKCNYMSDDLIFNIRVGAYYKDEMDIVNNIIKKNLEINITQDKQIKFIREKISILRSQRNINPNYI